MNSKIFGLVQIIFLTASIAFEQISFQLLEEADTRFVMNLGRYVMEHGFPHVDPFTIHENLQLVAQQWLSGVFFWEAYKNFGLNGLCVVNYIFGAAAVLIYWRLCLLVSGNKILSFAMAFAVGIFIAPMVVSRPHIISAPLFVVEILLLEKFTRTGEAKFLLPLPIISTLLVNFHAAVWLMSLVLCLPFLFVRDLRHVKFLLAAMAGIFFCGLINPYGLDAMTYVLRSYGIDLINSHIPEMLTPSSHSFRGKIFYLAEALTIISLAKFKVPWRYVLLSGGIIFMAIMHWRNLILFYLLATFPVAYAWRDFTPERFFTRTEDGQYKNRGLMMLTLFLLLFVNTVMVTFILKNGLEKLSTPLEILFFAATLAMLYVLLVLKVEGRILHPSILPRKNLSLFVTALIVCGIFSATLDEVKKNPPRIYTQAIEFLLRTERPENISLYANQGVGGLAGEFGIRYYIDSRSEVFFKANNGQKNIFEEYMDLMSGKIYYKDFFARYKFTHIILTSNKPFIFDQISHDRDFRVIYESEHVEGADVVHCKIFVPKEFQK